MQGQPDSIEPGKHGPRLRVHWRRLGIFAVTAPAALWLVATFGAWLYVRYHRQFSGVRYTDLLWPGRWPAYRISEGNHYIACGGELLRKGEVNAALLQLRVGLAKSPANVRGRTTLAGLYLALRRPDLAREVLLDGLRHLSGDVAYLQTTFTFLLDFQEDAKLLEVAGHLLAAPADSAVHRLVATYAATAAYYRGNYDHAEDFISQHRVSDTAEGAVLLARIEWERGYPELALLRLAGLLARQPGHEGAHALRAGYYRELGRTAELESAIVERLVSDPLSPASRIEHLHLHLQRGDMEKLERDTAAYLGQFQHDPAALLRLADFAARTGRPALARRVRQIFAGRHDPDGATALMVAEAHLVAGEYQAALDLIGGYARDFPEWTEQFAPICNGLQTVALLGLGRRDEARLQLDHLLARNNLRAENLVAVSHRLDALGARDLALSALNRAVEADPLNQAALAGLLRLELDTGSVATLPAHLGRYLRTRKPSREILSRAYTTLGSDRQLFLPAQTALLADLRAVLNPGRP